MQITIDLISYYDWEQMEGQPTNADVLALRVKPDQGGKWLKKIVKIIGLKSLCMMSRVLKIS
jgi:hypothetical protein